VLNEVLCSFTINIESDNNISKLDKNIFKEMFVFFGFHLLKFVLYLFLSVFSDASHNIEQTFNYSF